MPDYKGHNEPMDRFSAGVKARMENHRLPVDADCWSEIEARMELRPRRKGGRIAVLTAVAAAVALLLLVPFTDLVRRPAVPEALMASHVFPSLPVPEMGGQLPFGPVAVAPVEEWQAVAALPSFSADIAVPDDEVSISPVDLPVRATSGKANLRSGPEPERSPFINHYREERNRKADRKAGKWLLATAVGTGGRPSLLPNSQDYAFDAPSYDSGAGGNFNPGYPGGKPEADISPEQYAEADYAPTLSFGFVVRKNLNKRLALESGLVYSYLYTKMRGLQLPGTSQALGWGEAKLGLHYLGIPLNLVVNLWDDKRWNVYLSGGPMVEKGLRSVFLQEIRRSGLDSNLSESSGIRGLQWSLNMSAGAAYRFLPDWGVYVEPRFSYYFDTDQPRSIRTDKSSVIGINAGVRFEF